MMTTEELYEKAKFGETAEVRALAMEALQARAAAEQEAARSLRQSLQLDRICRALSELKGAVAGGAVGRVG